ncbi:MAG: DNA polymerase III subunit delta [Puniceicoccales bacterium]|jgi:DNA polymerase-3 subunit delta|nr:DNA polymerase III subunit delta [Puniceicoccales bacterium]
MQDNNKSVTFVYGGDDFLVDRRARVIFNSLGDGQGEIFTFDEANDLSSGLGNAISFLDTLSLFPESQTVWLRSAYFLGEPSLPTDQKDLVLSLFESIKSAHDKKVIISTAKVDRRTKIFKDLTQSAAVESIDIGSDAGPNAIEQFANDNGMTMDPDAIQLLQSKCGNNARLWEQEINKLSAYALGRKNAIARDDVLALTDDYDTGNFFEPIEKFFESDLDETFKSIDRYFFHGTDARALLSALQSRNRTLIQLRTLMDSGHLKVFGHNFSKNDFIHASKFFHMESSPKTTFNVFSQNTWYLSKLIPLVLKYRLSNLLDFQTLFTAAFDEITQYYQDQKSIIKGLAVKCYVVHG